MNQHRLEREQRHLRSSSSFDFRSGSKSNVAHGLAYEARGKRVMESLAHREVGSDDLPGGIMDLSAKVFEAFP